MVKGNLCTTAGEKFIKSLNWLHNILPRCKPALYLADVTLSAAMVDKSVFSVDDVDDNAVKN